MKSHEENNDSQQTRAARRLLDEMDGVADGYIQPFASESPRREKHGSQQKQVQKKKAISLILAAAVLLAAVGVCVWGISVASRRDDNPHTDTSGSTDTAGDHPLESGSWRSVPVGTRSVRTQGITTSGIQVEVLGTIVTGEAQADAGDAQQKIQVGHSACRATLPFLGGVGDTVSGTVEGMGKDSTLTEDEKEVLSILSIYMTSTLAFDYRSHFSLFPYEFVKTDFLDQINQKANRYTFEEAMNKIDRAAHDLMPFDTLTAEYEMRRVPASIDVFLEYYDLCGLDPNKVSQVMCLSPISSSMTANGIYDLGPIGYDVFWFFKYDGTWYPGPSLMDDDMSVDLVQSDPDNTQQYWYKISVITGTVEDIRNGYLYLSEELSMAFCIRNVPSAKDYSPGDQVILRYYAIEYTSKDLSTGHTTGLNSVVDIQPYDSEQDDILD